MSVAALERAAKWGGLRLSRRLVVRRFGQTITKPVFAAKPALRVLDAQVKQLATPDEGGNDIKITLRFAYSGRERNPQITSPGGLSLHDQRRRAVNRRSYSDTARRQVSGQVYALTASTRKADLRSVRRLRVEAEISDSHALPMSAAAIATVPAAVTNALQR